MNKKLLLLCIACLNLIACASHQQNLTDVDTTNLSQLKSVRVNYNFAGNSNEISQLRVKSLEDSAMSIGAQAGLAWASQHINVSLEKDGKFLDTIFNFNGMILSHGVMPPVLEEGDYTLNLSDPNTIRVADRTYKIVAQARFTTTPPNWREYLWLSYSKPVLPDKTLLPKSDFEQKVWRDAITLGWSKGIDQAYDIFQQNLARLKRDFRGMALYRKLLQEKMISAPFVATTELGVTGSGDDMRINDQVLRIVDLPQLQTNSRNWQAVVVKE